MKYFIFISMFLGITLGVIHPTPLPAQEPTNRAINALIEEQANLEKRLTGLKALMQRLVNRYYAAAGEDKKKKGELLKEGLQFLANNDLEGILAKARKKLEEEHFNEAQKTQLEAIKLLSRLQSLLLNRADQEDWEKQLAQKEKDLESIGNLISEEEKIQKKTAKAADASRSQAEKALDRQLAELARQQRKLAAETMALANPNQASTEEALAALKKIATELGREHERLTGAKAPSALPREVKEHLKEIRKLTPQAGTPVGDQALAELAEKIKETAKKAQSQAPEAAKFLDQVGKKLNRTMTDPAAAAEREVRLEEVTSALEKADFALSKTGNNPAFNLGKAGSALKNAKTKLPLEKRQTGNPVGDQLAKAEKEIAKAQAKAKEYAWPQAGQAADKARKAIDEAVKTLEDQIRNSALNKDDLAKLAGAQKKLKAQADLTAKAMDQAQKSGQLNGNQANGAKQQMAAARQAMSAAEKSLKKNQPQTARNQQKQAASKIENARQAMRAGHRPNAKTQEKLDELAKEQTEVRRRILELARRMKKQKERKQRQNLESAAEKAKQAQRSLKHGDMEEAQKEEEKVRQELKKAAKEITLERNRYLNLRQEELLFQTHKELKIVLESHMAYTESTKKYTKAVNDRGGNPSRRVKRRLKKLASQEKDLAGTCNFLKKNIAAEGSTVYSHILQTIELDLEEVSRLLSAFMVGPMVLSIQSDITENLQDLLTALKRTLNEKKKEDGQQKKQPPPPPGENTNRAPQKPKLVPDIAELKMLKRIQLRLINKTELLRKQLDFTAAATILAAEIERLAHRQAKVAKLFDELVAKLGLKPATEAPPVDETKKEREKEEAK